MFYFCCEEDIFLACGEDGYESKTCFWGPACPPEVSSMSSKLLHCAQ